MKSKLTNASNILMFLMLSMVFSSSWASYSSQTEAMKQKQTETTANSNQKMEVIGVEGKRPLMFFRHQMEAAELDFYDAFNAVADNKNFIVQCRRENRRGSHIKTMVCYPQYVLDRLAQETENALSSNAFHYRSPISKFKNNPSLDKIEFLVEKERKESLAYVEKLVSENPQLLEKLVALNEKQAQYEQFKSEN